MKTILILTLTILNCQGKPKLTELHIHLDEGPAQAGPVVGAAKLFQSGNKLAGMGAEGKLGPRVDKFDGKGAEGKLGPRVDKFDGKGAEGKLGPRVDKFAGKGAEGKLGPRVDKFGGKGAEGKLGPRVDKFGGMGAEGKLGPRVDKFAEGKRRQQGGTVGLMEKSRGPIYWTPAPAISIGDVCGGVNCQGANDYQSSVINIQCCSNSDVQLGGDGWGGPTPIPFLENKAQPQAQDNRGMHFDSICGGAICQNANANRQTTINIKCCNNVNVNQRYDDYGVDYAEEDYIPGDEDNNYGFGDVNMFSPRSPRDEYGADYGADNNADYALW